VNNIRRGQRVRTKLNGSYRHYLNGLEGEVVAVYHHGVAVALESPPLVLQNVIGPGGSVGPAMPNTPIYVFQFSEVETL
jgi:hypothetical protein